MLARVRSGDRRAGVSAIDARAVARPKSSSGFGGRLALERSGRCRTYKLAFASFVIDLRALGQIEDGAADYVFREWEFIGVLGERGCARDCDFAGFCGQVG